METQLHGHEGHEIRVIVFAPRSPEPKDFRWRKDLKVGEAAREAATAFGYKGGNPGLQTEGQRPRTLDNNKTLEQEHVHNDERLEVIDTGGGV